MSSKLVLAFDLYGTLLDTSSIGKQLQEILPLLKEGENAEERLKSVVTMWRTQQLEYTWRLNSMESYMPFDAVTSLALQATLAAHNLPALSPDGLKKAKEAYHHLSLFPGTREFFNMLATRNTNHVIFTNGTSAQVQASLKQAPETFQALLSRGQEAIISVDDNVRRFKPAPGVYEDCAKRTNSETKNMVLVSCNPFDIVGAMKQGWKAIWVERAGKEWVDRLGEQPTWTVKDLGEIMWVLDEIEKK